MEKIAREILTLSLDELLVAAPVLTKSWVHFEEERPSAEGNRGYTLTTPDSLEGSITFNNVELLKRFTRLGHASKVTLMKSIRTAMEREKVNILEVSVPWHKSHGRVVRIVGHYSMQTNFQFHLA